MPLTATSKYIKEKLTELQRITKKKIIMTKFDTSLSKIDK